MADKGKWFKLHIGWDDDPHIDALSLEDQARWTKFGTYMKEHGTDGTVTLVEPARSLQNKFRVSTFEEVIFVLQKFPNCDVGEKQKLTVTTVTSLNVTIKNWHRYQGDFSGDRVRKFRAYVTAKKRGEEKRREKEEKNNPLNTPLEIPEVLKGLKLYSQDRKLCSKLPQVWEDWKRAYPNIDLTNEINKAHTWELTNQIKKRRLKFLNTWFSNAQDGRKGNGYAKTNYSGRGGVSVEAPVGKYAEITENR